jgi:uncharacterized UBP type Zn finger protein
MLAGEASANERTHEGQRPRAAVSCRTRKSVKGDENSVGAVTRRKSCDHLASIVDAGSRSPIFCEECLGAGTGWASLRVCLSCGHVGCAEDSPGDHAAQHYAETDHPIAVAVGSYPSARWCYPHGRLV